MEKNKSHRPSVRAGGASYSDAAGENGFGMDHEAPFSRPAPAYTNGPNQPMIVNNNFTEEKYSGGSAPSREGVSAPGAKDSIETGGR